MEIKIDTTRDSSEDIKKTIKFLQDFIEQSHSSYGPSNIFEEDASSDSSPGGLFSMFNQEETRESNDDYGNYDSVSSDDDEDPDIKIIPYE